MGVTDAWDLAQTAHGKLLPRLVVQAGVFASDRGGFVADDFEKPVVDWGALRAFGRAYTATPKIRRGA